MLLIELRMFALESVRIYPSKTFYYRTPTCLATTELNASLINHLRQSKLFPALLIDTGMVIVVAAMNLLPFLNITQSVFVNLEKVKDEDNVIRCYV